ncbi:MAG: hypothetical protein V7459_10495 [Oceanicoccus sp.]
MLEILKSVSDNVWRGVALLLAVISVCLVYVPGISGEFMFDDFNSIVLNEQLRITELSWDSLQQLAMSGDPGVLGRPVSMISFGLNYFLTDGIDASAFKLTNILIHLLAFIGVFAVSRSLLRVYAAGYYISQKSVFWLALAIAFLWAVSPLQVSSVLYAVQRMTTLSALFSLYALWVYIEWRQGRIGFILFVILFPLLSTLAFLSKENAVLIAGFVLLIEWFVFGTEKGESFERKWRIYRKCLFTSAAVCTAIVFIYLHFYVDWYSSSYLNREFTQAERLLTQCRVLLTYVQWIVIPDIQQYGFFHDDIVVSTGWFSPISTIVSALILSALTITLLYYRKRWPWAIFGLLWFFLGHSLESTFIPLEMVFEHRNYLPSVGIIFVIVLAAHKFSICLPKTKLVRLIFAIWIVFVSSVTLLRSIEWSNYHTQFLAATERHPNSARSQWELARWYLGEYQKGLLMGVRDDAFYKKAEFYADRAVKADQRSSLALLGLVAFSCDANMTIKPSWLEKLKVRLQYQYRVENHGAFKRMADCVTKNDRPESMRTIVGELFMVAIKGEYIGRRMRSDLQYVYGMYLNDNGDREGAVQSFKDSLVSRENENSYIRLVIYSLETQDKANAVFYLEQFKVMLGEGYHLSEQYQFLHKYVAMCCDGNATFKLRQ